MLLSALSYHDYNDHSAEQSQSEQFVSKALLHQVPKVFKRALLLWLMVISIVVILV